MRENYYIFLVVSAAWMVGLAIVGPLVLGIYVFPAFVVSASAVALLGLRFTCAFCAHPIVRPRMTVGAMETTGYTAFPGRTCTNCGQDVSAESS